MSLDQKRYLAKHNIPLLVDTIVQMMLDSRPRDAMGFFVEQLTCEVQLRQQGKSLAPCVVVQDTGDTPTPQCAEKEAITSPLRGEEPVTNTSGSTGIGDADQQESSANGAPEPVDEAKDAPTPQQSQSESTDGIAVVPPTPSTNTIEPAVDEGGTKSNAGRRDSASSPSKDQKGKKRSVTILSN